MENMIDIDKIEKDFNQIEDPNNKTWINEALFKSILFTILYMEIAIIGFAINVNPISVDFNVIMLGQKIMIIPVLIVGFKTQVNEKTFKHRKELEQETEENRKIINELTKENYKLKLELDAKSQLYQALKDANEKADEVLE